MQLSQRVHRRADLCSTIRAFAFAGLLGLTAGACGPRQRTDDDPPLRSTAPVDRVSYEDSLAVGVNLVPARQMRAAMRARYRLHPDRRFLLAIADVHHTLTGDSLSVVHARRRDNAWVITYKHLDVGTMPDVPTYQSAQALLDAWVTRIAREHPVERPSAPDSTIATASWLIVDYTPERLFEALRLIDSRWSRSATRDPALLAPAARALVGLVMQGVDQAESADVLAGRALAYVSLARTLSGDQVGDADALLASLFGYRDASIALASTLTATHPVRLLVNADLSGLARAAADSASPRIAKFANLRALAIGGHRDEWTNAVRALRIDFTFDPEAAATGLLLNDFVYSAALPGGIEKGVIHRLAPAAARVATTGGVRLRLASYGRQSQVAEDESPSPANTLPRLDARARELAPTLVGPALDASVFASYHRGLLHSAYLSLGLFHLELRADYPTAVEFSRRFEGLDSTTADGELGAWYTRLANAYATGADRMTLIDDLARYRSLSGAVLRHTFAAMSERAKPADPRRARMTRLLGERLDTRPSDRANFASAARDELLDPVLVAQLYSAGNAALVHENAPMAVWLATAYRDTATLRAIVNDNVAETWARGAALGWLAEYTTIPVGEHKQTFERIIADDPRDWDARSRYIAFLHTNRDYAAAEQEAKDYIRLGRAEDGFDLIAAHVSIGTTLIAQGRHREAYAALRPAIETYQGGAMNSGVKALARGGRLAEAAALADRTVQRYPDSGYGRATRMEVWWRQGNHAAVAKELKEHDWLSSEQAVAAAFIGVFGGAAGENAAAKAAYALVESGVPSDAVSHIGGRLQQAGRNDLAFEFASRATDPNPMAAMFQTITASRLLATARGQDAALDWLRERLPMPLGDDLSFFLVDQGHDELLWTWDANDGRDEGRYTWLMRALVAVRSGLATNPHRQQLLDHYAAPDANPYYMMGRFLVGLETEEAMLALAENVHRKCEISFYLGARTQAEGRLADAVDWFRVAVETAQLRDGEYYWAVRVLAELSVDPRGLIIPSATPGVP